MYHAIHSLKSTRYLSSSLKPISEQNYSLQAQLPWRTAAGDQTVGLVISMDGQELL